MTAYNKLTILVTFIAIFFGLLISPLPRQYPIFHWVCSFDEKLIGLLPATTPHPWGYTFEQLQQNDLRGQSALITGANSGIGFEIARSLSTLGASVTLACRNPQRCFEAVDRIRKADDYSGAPLQPLIMDVSSLRSVQAGAMNYIKHNPPHKPLDMLFLNAGVFAAEFERGASNLPTSKDGIELVFATNVVGHHLLYRLLEPALKLSKMARVVQTSSIASIIWSPKNKSEPLIPSTLEELNEGMPSNKIRFRLYGRSKLGQVVWSKALTRRLGDQSSIYANAATPGAAQSEMTLNKHVQALPKMIKDAYVTVASQVMWSSLEGALTELYLAVATDELKSKNIRGKYYHPQATEIDHPYANDEVLQDNVWNLCEVLVKDFLHE